MKSLPTHLAACALMLAGVFLAASCAKKTPAPEAFTAQLEDIDGAMFFYSLQHPKLIGQNLDKLIAEVPEASYARILLETYGAQYGYPGFAEIAPDSNIGMVQSAIPLEQFKQGKNTPVIFIKIKEGGKIWNALVNTARMRARKHGDWTMFAQTDDAIDAIKNPGAITDRLGAPQKESLRVWARANGDTAAACAAALNDIISKAIGKTKLPDIEKNAFTSYARILVDEILGSAHSGHATLNLADTSLQITYGAQFKPDTPLGTFLRYRSDATPSIAQYVANDTLLTATFRITPKASQDLTTHLTNLLTKVDYPPISEPLAKFDREGANYWEQMDGCGALAMNIDMDLDNPLAPKTAAETFTVYSGKFDRKAMQYVTASMDLMVELVTQASAIMSQAAGGQLPKITITGDAKPVTIEGTDFSSISMTVSNNEITMPAQTTYYGVAGGNFVTSTSEATLKTRLPALLAKKTLPENVAAANPLQPYDIMSMTVNGGALVDMICKINKINLADPDTEAIFATAKTSYKQAAPARFTAEARQADFTYKVDVPYKFIAASVQLGRYANAARRAAAE